MGRKVFKAKLEDNPLKTIILGRKKGVKIGSLIICFKCKPSRPQNDQIYNNLRNMMVKEKNLKYLVFQKRSRKSS